MTTKPSCYFHFYFCNGSNPYIAITCKKAFEMLTSYFYEQTGEKEFTLYETTFKPTCYHEKKLAARTIAINFQADFNRFNYSYSELFDYQTFFEYLGKKYGLLTEYRENGIL